MPHPQKQFFHDPLAYVWIGFFLLQIGCLLVLQFGDIGFDHPGRFGLDFGHAILLNGLYLISLVAGTIVACVARRWKLAVLPWVLLTIVIAIPVIIQSTEKTHDAREYQHLVGQPAVIADELLKGHRIHMSGFQKLADQEEQEWRVYRGIQIINSTTSQCVTKVEPYP